MLQSSHVNYHSSILVKLLETESASRPNLLPTSVVIARPILNRDVLKEEIDHFEVALLANLDLRYLRAQLGEPASTQQQTSIRC